MAKQSKSKKLDEWYYNSKEDRSLLLSSKFTYEVEVYKYIENSFNLEDSKYIQSTECCQDGKEVFTKEGVRFRKVQTLIAAPKKWLEENNYKLKQNA